MSKYEVGFPHTSQSPQNKTLPRCHLSNAGIAFEKGMEFIKGFFTFTEAKPF